MQCKTIVVILPKKLSDMKEEILAFVWNGRHYNRNILHTVDGENIEVIEVGTRNYDSGPDIFNARIRINGTLWAGNVEFHLRSSDWYHHGHHIDPAYDNIILHVVYESDTTIKRPCGAEIPELELRGKMAADFLEKYHYLMNNKKWVPCENMLSGLDSIICTSTAEAMFVERYQRKAENIISMMDSFKLTWNEALYRKLASNFGFKLNNIAFEVLAASIPLSIASKVRGNIEQLEALYFGQSGLLDDAPSEPYADSLKKEYQYQQKRFNLKKMDKHIWKSMRTRPGNFPCIRIAQFAMLIHSASNLLNSLLETENLYEIKKMFKISASSYWDTHRSFTTNSKFMPKTLGESAKDNIVINTVLPLLFAYSRAKDESSYIARALKLIEELPAEDNTHIRKWKALGVDIKNALFSQGFLELKNSYCARKKCLHCRIGNKILKQDVVISKGIS